jgi:hypothetical protein
MTIVTKEFINGSWVATTPAEGDFPFPLSHMRTAEQAELSLRNRSILLSNMNCLDTTESTPLAEKKSET